MRNATSIRNSLWTTSGEFVFGVWRITRACRGVLFVASVALETGALVLQLDLPIQGNGIGVFMLASSVPAARHGLALDQGPASIKKKTAATRATAAEIGSDAVKARAFRARAGKRFGAVSQPTL